MKYLFTLFLLFVAATTFSQFVGLNQKEIIALSKLVKHDSSTKKFYSSIKLVADHALNQLPNPIDTVISEGHLATDPKKIKTIESLKDVSRIYSLTIAYAVEGNKNIYKKQVTIFFPGLLLISRMEIQLMTPSLKTCFLPMILLKTSCHRMIKIP